MLVFLRYAYGVHRILTLQRFKDVHRSKAKIHTYLAWQEQPGLPLGVSIKAKAFDSDAKLAHDVTDWLKTLFA